MEFGPCHNSKKTSWNMQMKIGKWEIGEIKIKFANKNGDFGDMSP